ncbi:hypothetical protein [Streptomyces sp.]|uniref:hypothetical protein n=1 Tax=Streptomyces sp. TaxID=1931 RepID=UPI002811D194|nr:hypothetical protein [Streptomyces sp.]
MHQHFRPWGTVSPEFWALTESARPEAGPAADPATPQQTSAATNPPDVTQKAESVQHSPAAEPASQDSAPARPAEADTEGQTPPGLHDRIASVTSALHNPDDRHALGLAGVEAEKLDQELTQQYGQHHPFTVNIRELRGWIAHLAGDSGTAARWYLHTTGLQISVHGPTHEQTQGSARRAVHTWQQVTDPVAIVQIGIDLANVVAAVLGPDSDAARFVQARVASSQAPEQ